jgi:peptidoglycan hydrolase CwlO-like protein
MTAVTRDEFETVKDLLGSAARYAESAHRGLDRLELSQQRTQLQLDQLGLRVDQLTGKIDNLTEQVTRLTSEISRLAAQADTDRATFRSTVLELLQVLTQQQNGNGHGQLGQG